MKILTLLRHAKSTWDDPVTRDFDRPLNPRGRRAARAVGAEMKAQELRFDRVVASPAVRVVETLEEVAAGYGQPLDPAYDERVYLASTATLLDIVRSNDAGVGRLLLVGHNPGLESLVLLLTRDDGSPRRAQVEVKYPTGTVAEIIFDLERWDQIAGNKGLLQRLILPRELDPSLGPDEDSD